MLIFKEAIESFLSEEEARILVTQTFVNCDLTGQRVLVIIPDGTRSMPTPLFFRLFYEALAD